MPQLEQAGTFRGEIIRFGVQSAESGAKSVAIVVQIHEIWEDGQWHDWREYGMEVGGNLWLVKKDGSLNEQTARNLVEAAGWDGNFVKISNGTWEPKPVSIVVEADEYKGNVRYRIAWVNPYESVPGGAGNMTPDEAKQLDNLFGAQLRALVSSQRRAAEPPPAGKPAKPAKSPATAKRPAPAAVESEAPQDEIPF